jgi:hypothetical protein
MTQLQLGEINSNSSIFIFSARPRIITEPAKGSVATSKRIQGCRRLWSNARSLNIKIKTGGRSAGFLNTGISKARSLARHDDTCWTYVIPCTTKLTQDLLFEGETTWAESNRNEIEARNTALDVAVKTQVIARARVSWQYPVTQPWSARLRQKL